MKRILKLPVLIHRHYRPVHFIKDTVGMLQETLPLRRKADFLTHTVKQLRAEFFLQKPDLDRKYPIVSAALEKLPSLAT